MEFENLDDCGAATGRNEQYETSAAGMPDPSVQDHKQDVDMPDLIVEDMVCSSQEPHKATAEEESNAQSATQGSLNSSQEAGQSMLPDPVKNLSKQVRSHRKVHESALLAKPRVKLASHRYWIAVRHPGKSSNNPEKKYTWFKGNRLTTIQTVDRMYRQHSWNDDCVLLWGGLKTHPADRMEQLDLFNDKVVVLSCFYKHDSRAGGLNMTSELIPAAVLAAVSEDMPEPITVD